MSLFFLKRRERTFAFNSILSISLAFMVYLGYCPLDYMNLIVPENFLGTSEKQLTIPALIMSSLSLLKMPLSLYLLVLRISSTSSAFAKFILLILLILIPDQSLYNTSLSLFCLPNCHQAVSLALPDHYGVLCCLDGDGGACGIGEEVVGELFESMEMMGIVKSTVLMPEYLLYISKPFASATRIPSRLLAYLYCLYCTQCFLTMRTLYLIYMPLSIPERRQKMRDQIRSQYLEAFFKQQRKKRDEGSLESDHQIQQFFRHSLATLQLDFNQFQIKKQIGAVLEQFQALLLLGNRHIALKQWIILVQIILKYLEQEQFGQNKIAVMERIKTMICSFERFLQDNKSLKWKIFNTFLDLMLGSQDILEYLSNQYITAISIIYKDLLMRGFSQNTHQLTKLLFIFNTGIKGTSTNLSHFIVDLCISQKWLLIKLIDFAITEHSSSTIALVEMILTLFLNLIELIPCNRISDLFLRSQFTQFLQGFLSFAEEEPPIISLLYLRLIHRIMTDNNQFLNLIRSLIDSSTLYEKFRTKQQIQVINHIQSLLQIMQ